jgi:ferric-dicitrate binding protein FerR (iron transport regulator)
MPSNTSIVQILWRHKNHEELTEPELAELREWLEESPRHEDLFEELCNKAKWDKEIAGLLEKDSNATWNRIKSKVEALAEPPVTRKLNWRPFGVAASLAILLGAGLYFWLAKKTQPDNEGISTNEKFKNEILPVTGRATLTLSDGTIIGLDTLKSGSIAIQGNTSISKVDSSGLNYDLGSLGVSTLSYNTLTTTRGGRFHITLPDGSKVWMNASSSLRFPVAFVGHTRSVDLTGEAYFEIVKNREKPFLVHCQNAYVKALGTNFNIRAYPDELTLKATLLEGSIRFGYEKDSAMVIPGQQVRFLAGHPFEIDSANLQQVLAWRNKLYWFQSTSFEEIMKELSRSYDIEVIYDKHIESSYSGILPQDLPLSKLLNILEQSGNVHFTIDGKRVSVQP